MNAQSKTTTSPVHNIFITTLGELIGISVLAIIADQNDDLGKVAVALMAGWLLVFLWTNASFLQGLTGKFSQASQNGG